MKLILPPDCKLTVIEYERNGERIIEVTSSPGNVGKTCEELVTIGQFGDVKAGRIFSFKDRQTEKSK